MTSLQTCFPCLSARGAGRWNSVEACLQTSKVQHARQQVILRGIFSGRRIQLSLPSQQLRRQDECKRHVCIAEIYTVELECNGEVKILQVPDDETILTVALDSGMDVPHDCNLGVCMTCPGKVESGEVDQSEGMLSDDVQEKGYALLCASYPRSDCKVRVIPEEELLSLQLATSD